MAAPAWRFEQSELGGDHTVSVAVGPAVDASREYRDLPPGSGGGPPPLDPGASAMPFELITPEALLEGAHVVNSHNPADIAGQMDLFRAMVAVKPF